MTIIPFTGVMVILSGDLARFTGPSSDDCPADRSLAPSVPARRAKQKEALRQAWRVEPPVRWAAPLRDGTAGQLVPGDVLGGVLQMFACLLGLSRSLILGAL